MSDQKPWRPNLHPKQWEVMNFQQGVLLVDGSRWGGKTWACLHRLVRHLWEVPNARAAIFAKSIKLAQDGGSWQLLLQNVLPEWLSANLIGQTGQPMEMITRNSEGQPDAKVDANTRTAYFEIRNMWGQTSSCMLFSINVESEIESKVKNKAFSMMFFLELTNWTERRLLPITLNSLRMPGLSHLERIHTLWMADTNPDPILGFNSPWYQIFYVERNKPPLDTVEGKKLANYYKRMHVIRIHWKDNPTVGDFQEENLIGGCHGDPILRQAYYDGDWSEGGFKVEKHFAGIFIRSRHVVGGGPGEGNQIDVSASTSELLTGWDLGGIYHGWVLLEKVMVNVGGRERSRYHVLDELLNLGEQITLEEYTLQVMKIMAKLEQLYKRKFRYTHWSDDSATTVWRPSVGAYDNQIVKAVSHNQINLLGVEKPHHSKETRVRIVKQLLRENRLLVSSRCERVIAMLENLKRDEKEVIVREHPYVHIFDALSYPIFMDWQDELAAEAFKPQATDVADKSTLVSV